MNRLHGKKALVRMLVLAGGILLLFSCVDEEDMRAKTVEEIGEPDEIEQGGWGPDVYELYYYDRKDINRVYEYRKSAPGCGSGGEWYIANVWYSDYHFRRTLYEPPTIVHSPVKTASPGTMLVITATITDDKYVKDAIVHYRIPGDEDFLPVTMSLEDSTVYVAEIMPEQVTSAGIEYFIEASDDGHKSRLPERKGTYTINIVSGAQKTVGEPRSTTSPVLPKITPVTRERSNIPI